MSTIWGHITRILGQAGLIMAAEHFFLRNVPIGGTTQFAVPKIYGMLFITNVFIPSSVMLYLAFGIVSPARKKYNVPLPIMYAESKKEGDEAYRFNCCQRAHQQALETFPMFLASSLIGGLKHPMVVGFAGLLWSYSRIMWGLGYATGDPTKRYTYSAFGRHIWTSLVIPLLCTLSTAVAFML